MTTEDRLKHELFAILEKVGQTPEIAKASVIRDSVVERLPPAKELQAGSLLNAFQATVFDIVDKAEMEDDNLFKSLDNLLDLSLYCTEQEMQDQSAPFCLIEDLLDVLTISGAERVIAYMEARVSRLTANIHPKRGKGLTLLRLCNEILRRLSRTKNTITAGRLLVFMASVFPLCGQSGVNLRGTFNLKNETHYEGEVAEMAMDTEGSAADKLSSLYLTFWHLQKFFGNPTLLWNAAEFDIFHNGIDLTLTRFEQINKETTPFRSSDDRNRSLTDRKRKARSDENAVNGLSHSLELRDPFFRRQILAQFSIILQYLLMLGKDEKEKVTQDLADYPDRNKSVQYPYTLTPEQETWLKEARNRSYTISESTYPYGKLFARNLSTVVTHERNWIDWKNRSCKSFELPSINVEAGAQKPKLLGSETVRRNKWLGNDQLTALWARGDDAEILIKSSSRKNGIPDFETLIAQLDDQLGEKGELTGGVEEEYALHKDMKFTWRTYRITMRPHLSLFHSNRQTEIQIDPKAPAKTLLMEWRKTQRKNEAGAPEGRDEKSNDGNEAAVQQEPMDTSGASRQPSPDPGLETDPSQVKGSESNATAEVKASASSPNVQSPTRKRSVAEVDRNVETPVKRSKIEVVADAATTTTPAE